MPDLLLISATVGILVLLIKILSPIINPNMRYRMKCAIWLILAARLMVPVVFAVPFLVDIGGGEGWISAVQEPVSALIGMSISGSASQGQDIRNQGAQGDPTTQGQAGQGQAAQGQAAQGQAAQGQAAQGQAAQGQTAHGQAAQGQTVQGQAAQGQAAPEHVAANQSQASSEQAVQKDSGISLAQILLFTWAIGVVGFLLYHAIMYRICRKQVIGRSRNVQNPAVLTVMQKLCMNNRRLKRIILAVNPDAASPMICGLFRTYLILPDESYSEDELTCILKHELCHCTRRDLWKKMCFLLANAVHWFNPLIYLLRAEASLDLEFACDESVTRKLSPPEKMAYNQAIVAAIAVAQNKQPYPVLSTSFNGGMKTMKKRMKNIVSKRKRFLGVPFLAGVLAVMVVTGCTGGLDSRNDQREYTWIVEPKFDYLDVSLSANGSLFAQTSESGPEWGSDKWLINPKTGELLDEELPPMGGGGGCIAYDRDKNIWATIGSDGGFLTSYGSLNEIYEDDLYMGWPVFLKYRSVFHVCEIELPPSFQVGDTAESLEYDSRRYALADRKGLITDFVYDEFDRYSYVSPTMIPLFAVRQGDKWGFVDGTGKTIVPFEFDGAVSVDHETAFVKEKGKWGIIRKQELPALATDKTKFSQEELPFFGKVADGMSEQEVVAILGEPVDVTTSNEIYPDKHYHYNDCIVTFRDENGDGVYETIGIHTYSEQPDMAFRGVSVGSSREEVLSAFCQENLLRGYRPLNPWGYGENSRFFAGRGYYHNMGFLYGEKPASVDKDLQLAILGESYIEYLHFDRYDEDNDEFAVWYLSFGFDDEDKVANMTWGYSGHRFSP